MTRSVVWVSLSLRLSHAARLRQSDADECMYKISST